MTTHHFPAMEISEPGYLQLAGRLSYTPWVQFDEDIMRLLQQILEEACEIDGCENPQVIADWREVARGADGRITHRSNILLYRDGGDWAEEEDGHYEGIGLLFCRQDIDQTVNPPSVSYRVHLPPTIWQDALLAACEGVIEEDLKVGNPQKLNTLRFYLGAMVNVQAVWKPLEQLAKKLGLEDEASDLD